MRPMVLASWFAETYAMHKVFMQILVAKKLIGNANWHTVRKTCGLGNRAFADRKIVETSFASTHIPINRGPQIAFCTQAARESAWCT